MLSILIPTYNYQVLPLVLRLSTQAEKLNIDYEILIEDDASTDNSISQESFVRIKNCTFYSHEKNLGRTKTRALLVAKASYDWLLFLDADVLPVKEDFLSKYIQSITQKPDVIFGGIDYDPSDLNEHNTLRWHYGKNREALCVSARNKAPYATVFSGNLCIHKSSYKSLEMPESHTYGLDIYMGYRMAKLALKIIHLNNPVWHKGIESNEVFLQKSLDAAISRIRYIEIFDAKHQPNRMLKTYTTLKKYKLLSITAFCFTLAAPFLKKKILKTKPNLFCFDLYRLGYMCKA